MARSISNAKFVSAFIREKVSVSASRGYAAAAAAATAQGSATGAAVRSNVMLKKGGEESGKAATSWIPDPVTGYYRPESHADEVDAAELRRMLLKNYSTRPH